MALKGIKTNTQKQETEDKPQTNGKYKIRQIKTKTKEHTHMYTHTPNQNSPKKKYKRVTCQAKETKNVIDQLKIKLLMTYSKHTRVLAYDKSWGGKRCKYQDGRVKKMKMKRNKLQVMGLL